MWSQFWPSAKWIAFCQAQVRRHEITERSRSSSAVVARNQDRHSSLGFIDAVNDLSVAKSRCRIASGHGGVSRCTAQRSDRRSGRRAVAVVQPANRAGARLYAHRPGRPAIHTFQAAWASRCALLRIYALPGRMSDDACASGKSRACVEHARATFASRLLPSIPNAIHPRPSNGMSGFSTQASLGSPVAYGH